MLLDRLNCLNLHVHVCVCAIAGLGAACDIASQEMQRDQKHIKRLSDRLYNGITSQLQGVVLNGDDTARYWGNVNLSFAYVEGESLLMGLKVGVVALALRCLSLAGLKPWWQCLCSMHINCCASLCVFRMWQYLAAARVPAQAWSRRTCCGHSEWRRTW